MSPALLSLAALLPAADGAGGPGAGGPGDGGGVSFSRDVRPIFNAHCSACHGGVREAGGLNLIDEDAALATVVPGDPESSYLLSRVADPDDATRMPPPEHGPRLSEKEVAALTAWVEAGAEWERHWSFVPPARPAVPDANAPAWCRSPVDRFVSAKRDAAGLAPNPPAAPDRWLRRATLDLTGLPPTVGERAAFLSAVATDGDRAYADAADRLLASPHFGERWASVWLDQIRYADSRGLGIDGDRTAWPYRDWVIDALNRDLPFDRFTVKQLAGDLLPGATVDDRVATAAHRLTQSNEEGGTDDEQFRTEAVIDRVATTWQVWQGLTVGCVQCHSHPYDPVRHDEFYRSLALFNDTADADLGSDHPTLAVPRDPADYARAAALDADIEPLARRVWAAGADLLNAPDAWEPPAALSAAVTATPGVEIEADAANGPAYRLTGTVARNTTVTLTATLPDGLATLTAVRFTGLPVDADAALRDAEWGFVVTGFSAELVSPAGEPVPLRFADVIADEPDPPMNPRDSLNLGSHSGFGAYTKLRRPRAGAFVLAEPTPAPPGSAVRVTLTFDRFELAAFPLVARRGRIDVSGDPRFPALRDDPASKADRATLATLRAARRRIAAVNVPVMRPVERRLARPTHVFGRGNMLDKQEEVSPACRPCWPTATRRSPTGSPSRSG